MHVTWLFGRRTRPCNKHATPPFIAARSWGRGWSPTAFQLAEISFGFSYLSLCEDVSSWNKEEGLPAQTASDGPRQGKSTQLPTTIHPLQFCTSANYRNGLSAGASCLLLATREWCASSTTSMKFQRSLRSGRGPSLCETAPRFNKEWGTKFTLTSLSSPPS